MIGVSQGAMMVKLFHVLQTLPTPSCDRLQVLFAQVQFCLCMLFHSLLLYSTYDQVMSLLMEKGSSRHLPGERCCRVNTLARRCLEEFIARVALTLLFSFKPGCQGVYFSGWHEQSSRPIQPSRVPPYLPCCFSQIRCWQTSRNVPQTFYWARKAHAWRTRLNRSKLLFLDEVSRMFDGYPHHR